MSTEAHESASLPPKPASDNVRTVLEVGGTLTQDTVWAADTVRMIDDVTIPNGTTLNILSGVTVLVEGHFAVEVRGTIRASGNSFAPIRFSSAAPEWFGIDSTTAGSWLGLRFHQTSATNDSSILSYCIMEYCKAAGDGERGAALSVTGFSKLRVSNCTFRHNVADFGAVAYCANFSAPCFVGCLMTDNYAFVSGSAVYCLDSYPALSHNTIVANHVLNEEIFDEAGVIHNHISKSRPVGCIIRGNTSNYFLGGQIREPKLYYTIYNDIEGGHAGEGNFDDDPLFVGNGVHPYALQAESPCIDQGPLQTAGLHLPLFDLAGQARRYNGRVDVGAYEWIPVAEVPDGSASEADNLHDRRTAGLVAAPNPCRGGTSLELTLPSRSCVQIWIVDVAGRRVATLWDGELAAGGHSFGWALPHRDRARIQSPGPGMYWGIVRVEEATITSTRIVVLP